MKKRYSIDLEYIKELKELMVMCNSDQLDIDRITNLIDRLSNVFNQDETNDTLSNIRNNSEYYTDFKELYKAIRLFVSRGIFIDSIPEPSYKEMIISDDDSITLAHDFYKEQGNFFLDGFNDFKSDMNDHLEFIEPNDYTDGEIHFYKSSGDAFLFTPDHKNFTKVSILIHELEHVIDCFNNHDFYENLLIRETSAVFMEMIGLDYLANVFKLEDAHYIRRFTLHSIVKSDAYNAYYKNQLLYLTNKYKDLDDQKLRKLLVSKFGMSNGFINFCNSYNLYQDYYYQLAQLVSIELYKIYNNDKEKALFVLKDIIMNGTDDNIFNILKKHNIVLVSNVVNYENDMCLKLGI